MTSRVFDCRGQALDALRAINRPSPRVQPRRVRGLGLAVATALLLVPIAGAAEPPDGWLVAGVTALMLLSVASIIGGKVAWGWVLVAVATAGVATPRGELGVIGPALFVATAICLVLWLANSRADTRRGPDGWTDTDARARVAQLVMGASGERRVGDALAHELPDDYVLINGLKLPRGSGDIDHLVVGPSGVFLVETKTMAGRIVCEPDGTWRRTRVGRAGTTYAAYIGDPAAQVQRNIFAVRECLRVRLPEVAHRTQLWIEGLLVFPHPRTELQTEHSRIPAVRLEDATPHICGHVPVRTLQPGDVERVARVLLAEAQVRPEPLVAARQSAQAVVELVLMVPVVLVVLFGAVAVSRMIQAQTAVVAVAHEAARAGALGKSGPDAVERMTQRVQQVAPGLGLDASVMVFDYDVSAFSSDPGAVLATVQYPVNLGDLPLSGWLPRVSVRAEHVEWVDPFRSGISAPANGSGSVP